MNTKDRIIPNRRRRAEDANSQGTGNSDYAELKIQKDSSMSVNYAELKVESVQIKCEIASLKLEIDSLQSSQMHMLATVVGMFKRERGEDGSLLRPDFDGLIGVMADLFDSAKASDVDSAYEMARQIAGDSE